MRSVTCSQMRLSRAVVGSGNSVLPRRPTCRIACCIGTVSIRARQAAAVDLYRMGFAIVTGEHVDERQRYTGETWIVEERKAVAALLDLANWAEPSAAPPRVVVYTFGTTSAGETALTAAAGVEPDEVRVKPVT